MKAPVIWIYIKCGRCGEEYKVRVDLSYEAEQTFQDSGPAFVLHKDTTGKKCPNLVRVEIGFDSSYNVLYYDSSGGEIIRIEYE